MKSPALQMLSCVMRRIAFAVPIMRPRLAPSEVPSQGEDTLQSYCFQDAGLCQVSSVCGQRAQAPCVCGAPSGFAVVIPKTSRVSYPFKWYVKHGVSKHSPGSTCPLCQGTSFLTHLSRPCCLLLVHLLAPVELKCFQDSAFCQMEDHDDGHAVSSLCTSSSAACLKPAAVSSPVFHKVSRALCMSKAGQHISTTSFCAHPMELFDCS